jgi:hypothetical protein
MRKVEGVFELWADCEVAKKFKKNDSIYLLTTGRPKRYNLNSMIMITNQLRETPLLSSPLLSSPPPSLSYLILRNTFTDFIRRILH